MTFLNLKIEEKKPVLAMVAVIFITTPFALCMGVPAIEDNSETINIYVSASGADSNSGTKDKPVTSFQKAREIVRLAKNRHPEIPVNVIVREGVYYLGETFELVPADGGSEAAPVTWKAAEGEKVIIRGGRKITGWEVWKDNIYKVDLKKHGLDGVKFHQLFYKSKRTYNSEFCKRQVLARHPNFDPGRPRTGGNLYTEKKAERPSEQLVYRKGDIPFDKWDDISQAEIVSTYHRGWNFAITPVEAVDEAARTITVAPLRKGVGEFIKLNRFFIQNVLDALDRPGEWYLDYDTSVLYFYPPDGLLEQADVIVPTYDNIIEIKGSIPFPHGYLNKEFRKPKSQYRWKPEEKNVPLDPVKYINIEGFSIECARQDAIRIAGAVDCSVSRCRITNAGNVGINLGAVTSVFPEVGNPRVTPASGFEAGAGGGGQVLYFKDPCRNCTVIGNDIWDTGSEGIALYGVANVAENNHVYDIGLYAKDAACIGLFGERNIARRNTLHDCPRCAVFLKGIDNIVEYNDVHHTIMETTDMGAIRMVQRNIYLTGNIIRYNRIFDVVGYGYDFRRADHYVSPFYTFGIYLDDFTSGTEIYGNIISRVGRAGVMIHGGGRNSVKNNVLVNAGPYQVEFVPIPPRNTVGRSGFDVFQYAFEGNVIEKNVMVCTNENAVSYRFFRPDTWGGKKVHFEDNIIYYGDNEHLVGLWGYRATNWNSWLEMGMDSGSVIVQDNPVEYSDGFYTVNEGSAAFEKGFEKIDVSKIGCYQTPHRASWPIEPNYIRYREQPVLFTEKDYDPQKEEPETLTYSQTIDKEFLDALKKDG